MYNWGSVFGCSPFTFAGQSVWIVLLLYIRRKQIKKGIGFETKKSKAAKEKIRIHCKAFGGTLDDMECMKLTGLARNTYYKYKRQIREDTEMKD